MPKKGFRHSAKSLAKMSASGLARRPAEQRFWAGVKKGGRDDCWLWTGGTYPDGYGRLWVSGRSTRVHKFSWTLRGGEPVGDLHVLHKCDTPLCVRPDHLFLGTARDNIDDMLAKGRSLKGERHNQAKLTEGQVIEILKWKRGGPEKLRSMAARMGVSLVALELIRSGTNWKHLYHHHSRFEE